MEWEMANVQRALNTIENWIVYFEFIFDAFLPFHS